MAPVDTRARTYSPAEAAGGKIGISERPFLRLYHTWGGPPIDNAKTFINAFHELNALNGEDPRHRHVLRSLMTPRGMHELVENRSSLSAVVEYALPVQVAGSEMFLVGAGKNGPERQTKDPVAIRNDILVYQKPPKTLGDHINHIRENGLRATIMPETPNQIATLGSLWGHAFGGWDGGSVSEFAGKLLTQTDPRFPADQRTDFFTGIVDKEGDILAATMAQAMVLQPDFTLWEVTEYIVNPNNNIGGLVAASAALTKAQIIHSFEGKRDYTIIAECNTSTPAPGVARSSGMVLPEVVSGDHRHYQVLRQNVGVNDGMPATNVMEEYGREFPLRDFGVFQLQPDAISSLYLPYLPGRN